MSPVEPGKSGVLTVPVASLTVTDAAVPVLAVPDPCPVLVK
jgi:hypothetical protein